MTRRWFAAWALAAAGPVAAQTGLPPEALALQALQRAPALAASADELQAAVLQRRQGELGEPGWVASLSAGRRREVQAWPERTSEWELSLQRTLRLPGKAALQQRLGAARQAQAEGARALAWRTQGRLLLELWSRWQLEAALARTGQAQAALLQEQQDTVARRQRAGAAALLERRQAEAAAAQGRAQAEVAVAREAAARQALLVRFPPLQPALADAAPLADPELQRDEPETLRRALLDAAPERLLAEQEAEALLALSRAEAAEQRPDPAVALRVGRARDGAETLVGIALVLPFGSEARTAGAGAAAARAAAAARRADDARLAAQAQAAQLLSTAATAQRNWQGQAEAARLLAQSADGVARAYALGDGTLADVLAARRLAHEQASAAAQAAAEAWQARWRLALETGALWPLPADAQTSFSRPLLKPSQP